MHNNMFIAISLGITVVASIIAILYAFVLKRKMSKIEVAHNQISEISSYIREGAITFMKRQYKIIIIFSIIVGLILVGIGFIPSLSEADGVGWRSAIAFFVGASFSGLTGIIGMLAATKANARTTDQARQHGMPAALQVAFTGGSILGLTVVGFGLLGLVILFFTFYMLFNKGSLSIYDQYFALKNALQVITGYGLGASLIALFGRVGGGIFTKAADVGADLVGKIESNIPEDDSRNPAVIADNVGDNVGDIAGMGSDLTESYIGSIISALTLGLYAFIHFSEDIIVEDFLTSDLLTSIIHTIMLPLLISGFGIIAAIISVMIIRSKQWQQPQKALNFSTYFAVGFMIIVSFILSFILFDNQQMWGIFGAIVTGLLIGIMLGFIAEYYTSFKYKHVKEIVKESKTGPATNIISGFSIGMQSTFLTIIVLVSGIILSYLFTGDMYGIALASVGMLSTAGITIAVDAYGPIADNAGGLAEMTHLSEDVRKITDRLDSVGNTTAAIGKGFCIGSAALTSIGLFFAFEKSAGISTTGINLLQPGVLVGVFIGAMLPYLFTSLVIKSVGKAANKMIEEVRRQYHENPNILKGIDLPDYASCVDISTKAALKEMIYPALIAILSPIIIGLLLGVQGLGGLLIGGLVSAMMLAIFMANSGGAWDNAKKYIEEGNEGGKGSDIHKATVVGDTVGDPFKDTAGPSMDILIKLMSIVSLVLVPVLIELEPLFSFLFN
ncbi:MAG: sodium-translocating pyrophosphatase [Acholeplasmataceae bacterium]